jgi:hypothetical protein
VPPPLSTSTTSTTAMVPASLFFFAQDPYNGNDTNRDLDMHPNSFEKRNKFLAYFNQTTSSPQQSFENFAAGPLTSPVSAPLSTIGNVEFSGNDLYISQDVGFDDSTDASLSLAVVESTAVNIVFPVDVVGVGFPVFDLETAIQLQFILNGTNVGSFPTPLNTTADNNYGVVFIGYINYNGFDTMYISSGDAYWIDQFTAYKASELLSPLP